MEVDQHRPLPYERDLLETRESMHDYTQAATSVEFSKFKIRSDD